MIIYLPDGPEPRLERSLGLVVEEKERKNNLSETEKILDIITFSLPNPNGLFKYKVHDSLHQNCH